MNPREYDNLGTMIFTPNRYVGADKGTVQSAKDAIKAGAFHVPVYAYIHSGVALSTSPFSCPWDSGQIGVVYATRARVREYFEVKRITAALAKQVMDMLKAEVEEYNNYLNGEE